MICVLWPFVFAQIKFCVRCGPPLRRNKSSDVNLEEYYNLLRDVVHKIIGQFFIQLAFLGLNNPPRCIVQRVNVGLE